MCGGAEASVEPSAPAADALELLRNLYVDGRTGIIGRVGVRETGPADLQVPVCARATVAAPTRETYRAPALETTGGKGSTVPEASLGAIAEGLERYSASVVRLQDLRHATLTQIGDDALDPRDLPLYDEDQYDQPGFPFRRFDPAQPLWWTRGRWIDDGAPAWVPALPAYYRFPVEAGDSFCQVTSSGLAAGRDVGDAAVRAVGELVERDAFLVSWLCRRPAPRISLGSVDDPEMLRILAELGRAGATVEMYLLDSPAPLHVVMCAGFGDGVSWPGAHIGVAGHADPHTAVRKALQELALSGGYVRRHMGSSLDHLEAKDIRTFGDHAAYYIPPDRAESAFGFLRHGELPQVRLRDLSHHRGDLTALGAQLRTGGVRVAVVDVTSPDLRAGPLRVVRALGTHLVPLHCGWNLHRKVGARLANVGPVVNPEPHPLC
jgi:ribosomal protein S12 methylthiotransferase accessory factor